MVWDGKIYSLFVIIILKYLSLYQGSPTPGPWPTSGPWPVWNWVTCTQFNLHEWWADMHAWFPSPPSPPAVLPSHYDWWPLLCMIFMHTLVDNLFQCIFSVLPWVVFLGHKTGFSPYSSPFSHNGQSVVETLREKWKKNWTSSLDVSLRR